MTRVPWHCCGCQGLGMLLGRVCLSAGTHSTSLSRCWLGFVQPPQAIRGALAPCTCPQCLTVCFGVCSCCAVSKTCLQDPTLSISSELQQREGVPYSTGTFYPLRALLSHPILGCMMSPAPCLQSGPERLLPAPRGSRIAEQSLLDVVPAAPHELWPLLLWFMPGPAVP